MNIKSIKVPTKTEKVVKDSHHASTFSLPCDKSSPRLGVFGGPQTKKI